MKGLHYYYLLLLLLLCVLLFEVLSHLAPEIILLF